VSAVDSNGRTIFITDADRENEEPFIFTADEKLTAFLELESQAERRGATVELAISPLRAR